MPLTVGAVARVICACHWSARLLGTALCLAAALPSPTLAQGKASGDTNALRLQSETLVLRASLNTENKGDLFVQRTADSDFLVRIEDLKAMGFRDPAGPARMVEGEPHLSLRAMPGVSFAFDARTLSLSITAAPHLLLASSITLRSSLRTGPAIGSVNSLFLNYALAGSTGGGAGASSGMTGEIGARWGDYLLLSDASTVETAGRKRFVRLMSSVTRDDTENLRRIVVGDLLTPTRDFSSSVNLGGISITKFYGLDPAFVRFPTQSLSGSVALPSDMEIYLDGQRIRTERIRPGEFELREILAYGGAQDVQVILRDPFGRVQRLSYSLYFSEQPLQKGLHEYSYNLGAMRRGYGSQSYRYGPAAFSMFHRYGLSNWLTLGWRAEAARNFLNAGPTATVVLGTLGVVSLGVAGSVLGERKGAAALASYAYQSRMWSTGLFLRKDGHAYASLGDPPVMTNRKTEGTGSVSLRLPASGYVSLSHTLLSVRGDIVSAGAPGQPFQVLSFDKRRVTTLSYSTALGSTGAQLSTSLSHTKTGTGPARNELFLGLNLPLGPSYTAATHYRRDGDGHAESLRFSKTQPYGEGLGYSVAADRSSANSESTHFHSQLQYNAPALVLRSDYSHFLSQGRRGEDHRISLAGAVLAIGDHVALSRPITQSYAIVKVGELAGVGVAVNNQEVAKTNAKGIAIVPNLNPYNDNSVSIGTLPIEYGLPANRKRVVPTDRSGSFIDFQVAKIQGISGKLVRRSGSAVTPVEFLEINVNVGGKSRTFVTGRGGEFYAENLEPGTYPAGVSLDAGRCVFDLSIPRSEEMFVELGQVVCVPVQ